MTAAFRCPSCAAALQAEAQWCSLCYAALRPAPPPGDVQRSSYAGHASGPRHAGGHSAGPKDAAAVLAEADLLLTALAAEERGRAGSLAGRLRARHVRLVVMVVGVVAVSAVFVGVPLLLGALF